MRLGRGDSLQRANEFVGHGRLPLLSAWQIRMAELVLSQDYVSPHEQLRQEDREHSAHDNTNDLVAELNDAVGVQAPPRGSVLLHVAARTAGDKQNGGAQESDSGVAQAQSGQDKNGHDERTGNRVPVRDTE